MTEWRPNEGGGITALATWLHEWYECLVAAGFSEDQAFFLIREAFQQMWGSS